MISLLLLCPQAANDLIHAGGVLSVCHGINRSRRFISCFCALERIPHSKT